MAVVRAAAVCTGDPGESTLVIGKARADGMQNTWRHALENWNSYKVTAGRGHGAGELQRVVVETLPLFGPGGVLASAEGASFVKLDVEGAELELLGAAGDDTAADPVCKQPSSWPLRLQSCFEMPLQQQSWEIAGVSQAAWAGVTHLVMEWSFTKDRRMSCFGLAVSRLRRAVWPQAPTNSGRHRCCHSLISFCALGHAGLHRDV